MASVSPRHCVTSYTDGFGNIADETGPAVVFLFGFTGFERDAESDLQCKRARYYDAVLGFWLSQGPISSAALLAVGRVSR